MAAEVPGEHPPKPDEFTKTSSYAGKVEGGSAPEKAGINKSGTDLVRLSLQLLLVWLYAIHRKLVSFASFKMCF